MVLSDNLMGLSQTFTSPDVVRRFSMLLGESEEKTRAGLKTAIPTLLMGIADKGATPEGAQKIANLAANHPLDPNSSANDLTETNLPEGNTVLNGIFGSGLTPMISRLGNFTGLNTSSVAKMLGLATPLVMGVIGNKVKKDNLNADGLMGFFGQQKYALAGLLPSSLGGGAAATSARGLGVRPYKTVGTKRYWFFAALAVLAVLIGLWFKSNNTIDQIPKAAITPTSPNVSSMPETTNVPAGTTSNTTAADLNSDTVNTSAAAPERTAAPAPATAQPTAKGQEATSIAASGTTGAAALSELSAFLKAGDAAAVPKRFSFKNLVFASSAAKLMPGAEAELDLIANAMKENGTATATIEGYTDNSGNAAANQILSENRAKEVKKQLVSRGIAENRITAVGKGSEGPIAPNETIEGRALNRRIEFVVTKIK
ncbi:OmpA family protein [Peredibacter starrii]|uniref:OmpA family protein n=1 Tax=Peredibacter starrii TaxID=28202 RepID=A0AAX4HNI8_9BACT|nr:OmpA family protein [Peredibacter starrii]WPU64836.1 OmpA family protein [Peredibacter starrii]